MRVPRRPFGFYTPAWLTLFAGVAAVFLRPPLPLDEIRYLEVAREMSLSSAWMPVLNGEWYPHKPPGMFWIVLGLHAVGLPLELAMRLLPSVFSAATVAIVSRLGRRMSIAHAGWIQAAMLLPIFGAQVLLFDPLVTFGVWYALLHASHGHRARTVLGASIAFLAKGPVAALFLLPLGWAFWPRQESRARVIFPSLATMLLGALPLATWALAAAWVGGPSLAHELLWRQSAGRITDSFAHAQPFYFYLPVLLVGLLPCSFLLFVRKPQREVATDREMRRLCWAVAVIVATFSLFSGKQPHYLLPVMPAFALIAAWKLDASPDAARWLRWTSVAQFSTFAMLVAFVLWRPPFSFDRYGDYNTELQRAPHLYVLAGLAVAGSCVAIVTALKARSLAVRASAVMLGAYALFAPAHFAAGRLLIPRTFADVLQAPHAPRVAIYKNNQAGLYNWMSHAIELDDLRSPDALAFWCDRHPGGWIIAEDKHAAQLASLHLEPVARDLVRGAPSTIYRAPFPSHAAVSISPTHPSRGGILIEH